MDWCRAGKGFQLLRGVQGEGGVAQVVIGGGLHAGQVGALYLSGVRHPALKAGYIDSIAHMAAVRQHRKTTQPFHAPRNTQKLLHSSISATKQPAAPHTTMRTRSVHGPRGSRGSNVVKDSAQCHSGAEGHTVFEHRRTQRTLTTSPALSKCRRR